jgi:hypothetical protein
MTPSQHAAGSGKAAGDRRGKEGARRNVRPPVHRPGPARTGSRARTSAAPPSPPARGRAAAAAPRHHGGGGQWDRAVCNASTCLAARALLRRPGSRGARGACAGVGASPSPSAPRASARPQRTAPARSGDTSRHSASCNSICNPPARPPKSRIDALQGPPRGRICKDRPPSAGGAIGGARRAGGGGLRCVPCGARGWIGRSPGQNRLALLGPARPVRTPRPASAPPRSTLRGWSP